VNALTDPLDAKFVRDFQISTVFKAVPDDFMNMVIGESLKLDASTWKGVIAGMTAYKPAEAQIKVPVLVIGGDRDAVFAVEEQHALVASIQGARVRILPNIGHTPHWEDPDTFVTELLAFIGAAGS
jgi:non-heme chloroperoxidase